MTKLPTLQDRRYTNTRAGDTNGFNFTTQIFKPNSADPYAKTPELKSSVLHRAQTNATQRDQVLNRNQYVRNCKRLGIICSQRISLQDRTLLPRLSIRL